jgi:hypothetical protein
MILYDYILHTVKDVLIKQHQSTASAVGTIYIIIIREIIKIYIIYGSDKNK